MQSPLDIFPDEFFGKFFRMEFQSSRVVFGQVGGCVDFFDGAQAFQQCLGLGVAGVASLAGSKITRTDKPSHC